MIKCEKGSVELQGNLPKLLSESSTIVSAMYDTMINNLGFPSKAAKDLLQKAMVKGIEAVEADSEAAEKAAAEKETVKERIIEVLDMLKEILTGKDEE